MGFLHRKDETRAQEVLWLDAKDIAPNPDQPRAMFSPEGLSELAESIRQHGVLQPLSVRRAGDGWELIAGERRLRAAKLAGLDKVPCLAVSADGEQSSLLALVENLQRQDLHYLEEAGALKNLMDRYGLKQEECARRLGKSQSAVANKLRLLRLSPEVAETLLQEGLSERHARALLRLPDDQARLSALGVIVRRELTVAETDRYIDSLLCPEPHRRKSVCLIRDVRLFLNTVNHCLDTMRSAGIPASCTREDREGNIVLTISISASQAPR